jgi:hypothetical protein
MAVLHDVLAQVKERIERYRTSPPINEQNTKAGLIDPVLRALGWDVEDIEEVHREYKLKTADNPVDYALLVLRTPRLFIEAKALGENLDDRRWAGQMLGYASVAGVEWVVLTDGDEYRIYNSHAAVPVDEKLFRAVRISDSGSSTEATLLLLSKSQMTENALDSLWQAYFVDRQIRGAIESLFAPAPDTALVRLISKRLPKLPLSEVRAGLSRVRLHLDFPSVERSVEPARLLRERPRTMRSHRTSGQHTDVSLPVLIEAGLVQPPLQLRKSYMGKPFIAQVDQHGQVIFDGQTYPSLSMAASEARRTVLGRYPQTNGWIFWQFQDSDGQVKPVDVLRQRYLEDHGAMGANR